jgi:cytochrome c2
MTTRRSFITLLGGAAGVLFSVIHPLDAQTRGNAELGRAYALNWCTECHSIEPETDGLGRIAPDFSAVAKSRSTSALSLYAFLRSDHIRMPNLGLRPTDANDLVAYIMNFRRR